MIDWLIAPECGVSRTLLRSDLGFILSTHSAGDCAPDARASYDVGVLAMSLD